MESGLSHLSTMVDDLLDCRTGPTSAAVTYARQLPILPDLTAGIRAHLDDLVCTHPDQRLLHDAIAAHHIRLVRLANRLTLHLSVDDLLSSPKPPAKHTWHSCCLTLYRSIEELIAFIEYSFSHYLTRDIEVCDGLRIRLIFGWQEQLDPILHRLRQAGVQELLLDLTIAPMDDFTGNPSTRPLTYGDVRYFNELILQLSRLTHRLDTEANPQSQLHTLLLYLNHNSSNFINYCTGLMQVALDLLDTETEKLEKIAWFLKVTHQDLVHTKTGFGLRNRDITVRQALILWLEREASYLQSVLTLSQQTRTLTPSDNTYTITLGVSAAKFAYILRLLVRHNVLSIPPGGLSALFRFTCTHFRLSTNHTISPQSFDGTFHKPRPATIDSVKSLLFDFIKHIKSEE